MRPRRDEEDATTTDDGTDPGTSEYVRERTISPEQHTQPSASAARAKSPAQVSVASRAVSPANGDYNSGQPPNLVGMTMNALAGRGSPVIDRTKPPTDAFYHPPGSPTVNGFPRPGSRGGSVGNVTADLIRDMKSKEAELDAMKRQMLWMKQALAKASMSGYIYADRDGSQVEGASGGADDSGEGRKAEMVLKFKQFKAHIQVRASVSADLSVLTFVDYRLRWWIKLGKLPIAS
jgi:hypothetical protein